MPVSQSWMTAVRVIALSFLFLPALLADVIVAKVVLGRHFLQALDAEVLSGALLERAAGPVAVHVPALYLHAQRGKSSTWAGGGVETASPMPGRRSAPRLPDCGRELKKAAQA